MINPGILSSIARTVDENIVWPFFFFSLRDLDDFLVASVKLSMECTILLSREPTVLVVHSFLSSGVAPQYESSLEYYMILR